LIAEISIQKNMAGKIVGFLYKPSQIEMELNLANGNTKKYRIVAGMVKTGIVISTLLETTDDFLKLYRDLNIDSISQDGKRVLSFKINIPNAPWQWTEKIHVKLKRLSSVNSIDVSRILYRSELYSTKGDRFGDRVVCEGSIDLLNEEVANSGKFMAADVIKMAGWAALPSKNEDQVGKILVVVQQKNGTPLLFDTTQVPRPDVAAHLKSPALNGSGYEASIDTRALSGEYTVGLALEKNGIIHLCSNLKSNGRINF